MGYSVNNKCYPDGYQANVAWCRSMPFFLGDGSNVSCVKVDPISQGGTIHLQRETAASVPQYFEWVAGANFPVCDDPGSYDPVSAYLIVIGCVLAFALGVVAGAQR